MSERSPAHPASAEHVIVERRRVRPMVIGATLVAAWLLLAVPAVLALAQAARSARTGADAIERALATIEQAHTDGVSADLTQARASFRTARDHLRGPLTSFGVAVPVVSANLRAARTLVDVGYDLAAAGAPLAGPSGVAGVRLAGGAVPITELRRLAPRLADVTAILQRSRVQVRAVRRPFLVPPLRRAVVELSGRLARQTPAVEKASELAKVLPAILGADGPRRYFLAFQNNVELRGSGGFIGNWGELVARDGSWRLERFGRIDELRTAAAQPLALRMPDSYFRRWPGFDVGTAWTQVNVSPDFPTTAAVIEQFYPQSGGAPIDGVIALDLPGLAALLQVTGPVTVEGWPVPIAADNVVDVTARAAYERYPDEGPRIDFLGRVAERTWQAFTTATGVGVAQLAPALSGAVEGGHLLVSLQRDEEQRVVRRLGADGQLPPVRGDSLLVVNQNVSANKVDLYLHRRLRYVARLVPDGRRASVYGHLDLTLQNDAPSVGLPLGVIGPHDARFTAGENRTYLSLYTPLAMSQATLDWRPVALDGQQEFGRQVYSVGMIIPSARSRTLALDLNGQVVLSADGWYRLDVLHQPSLGVDEMDVELTVPLGWRIAEARGLRVDGARRATAHLQLHARETLSIRLQRDA